MKFGIRLFQLLTVIGLTTSMHAQVTFPVNGIPDKRNTYYAFINAQIVVDYKTVISNGTLLIRDGKISDVGTGINIPKEAVVYDLKNKFIYPSFIDPYTVYGLPEPAKKEDRQNPQLISETKGAYAWNQALKPEFQAHRVFISDPSFANEYRKAGFGTVLSLNRDGIARGTAVISILTDEKENETVLKDRAATCFSFNKGSSLQDYPTSQMGAIALLRQTFLDAAWYKNDGNKPEYNISLETWNLNRQLPHIFEAADYLQSLRADKLGDEFGVKFIIAGSGDEYLRINEIRATGNPYIIPVKFPDPMDVDEPYDALNTTLRELKRWELAPTNAAVLNKANVPFAFTALGLKNKNEFIPAIRKTIQNGLPENLAVQACTSSPAEMLGISDKTGSLKKGMIANFLITSGKIFDKKSFILENWVNGKPFILEQVPGADIRGTYDLTIGNIKNLKLLIGGESFKPEAMVKEDTSEIKADLKYENYIITLSFELNTKVSKGRYVLNGYTSQDKHNFTGTGSGPDGNQISWNANWLSDEQPETRKDTTTEDKPSTGEILFPCMAYGFKQMPERENFLIKNVTVWTNEKDGILENTNVLVNEGKIVSIGPDISGEGVSDLLVIDGTGKHLTPGIIDEHSHIAISGDVNECSHSVTSEVRMGDVIDPDDIHIYRQLAGGVTTSQLLHGSCNSIGGQSAIIKLKWGLPAEKMKFEGAPGFIKFALGENVKQSNWGDVHKIRYPQTRMGVEQVYVDAFTRAKEYDAQLKKFSASGKKGIAPRRDLRLEALVEIMNEKRFITCHSYEQGEITMLMRVADSLGFRINTFTHILEGYKVADKLKAHGAGASSFSDWWAYKYEVMEAIPYNGAILHNAGVTVAYNSDDPEMARRLNQEAAKAVKYGGVTEEEALKFVTLNPAKLLHIDNKVGSIKPGKDADIVLWTGNPLSVYSKVLSTWIEGTRYFDAERDIKLRDEVTKEKARIIAKMNDELKKGGMSSAKKPAINPEVIKHCNTVEEIY